MAVLAWYTHLYFEYSSIVPFCLKKERILDSIQKCLKNNKSRLLMSTKCIYTDEEYPNNEYNEIKMLNNNFRRTITVNQRALSRKISNVEKRISDLLDLKLDGKVDDSAYEIKYSELYKQLNELKEEREHNQIFSSKAQSKQLRLERFQEILDDKDKLDSFDDAVFKTIVDKVIIGEMGEDGVPDPWKMNFIYKTKITDTKDVGAYKEKRKRRTKEQITKIKKMISGESDAFLNCQIEETHDDIRVQPPTTDSCRKRLPADTER